MSKRIVTQSGKDEDGDITKLCNPNEYWKSVTKSDAISHIDSGLYEYWSLGPSSYKESEVEVVIINGRKHLRTKADSLTSNNLDNLPDCTC